MRDVLRNLTRIFVALIEWIRSKVLTIRAKNILFSNKLGKSTKPSPKQYPHQWNWDSAFIALGVSRYDAVRAGEEIMSLLRGQWENGMLPHIVYNDKSDDEYFPDKKRWGIEQSNYSPKGISTSGITQPPMVTIAAHRILGMSGDGFGHEVYPKLLAYHQWLYRERDPKHEGLVSIIHPWESGLDNSPRWIDTLKKVIPPEKPIYQRKDIVHVSSEERPTDDEYDRFVYLMDILLKYKHDQKNILEHTPFVIQDVFFNSILHKANECLREIAFKLGRPKREIDMITEWLKTTRSAFEAKLWSTNLNMHCDYDLVNNNSIFENSVAIFAPLYAGLVGEHEAELIVRHLLDANEYAPDYVFTKYYVPTTSKNNIYYDPRRYWLGPIWVNTNWIVIQGLNRYGFTKLAKRIREDTIGLFKREGACEYFDPSTGKGYGTKKFSWSAALVIDLLSDKF